MSTSLPETADDPTAPAPETPADIPTLDVHALNADSRALARKFDGMVSEETIERIVYESYTTLHRSARVKTHLAALAKHFAEDRIRALAVARGAITASVPQVLFVDTLNTGRSQIASALLTHYAGGNVEVRSAGTSPGHEVHPQVYEAMNDRGVALIRAFPKPLTDDVVRVSDYVVLLGDVDEPPRYEGKEYLTWDVAAAKGATTDEVRAIVDDLDSRVRALWAEIEPADEQTGATAPNPA